MNVTSSVENEHVVITINGDVDSSSAILLDDKIRIVHDEGHKTILIDCANLNYISSAGLGVFMSYLSDFKESNTNMVLFSVQDKVKKVFELVGLDALLTIVSDRTTAINR